MNVEIKIIDKLIYFSIYNDKIKKVNLNNTNVINEEQMIFSKKYIECNYDIISTFINLIVLKKNITTAIIKSNELGKIILPIINSIPQISNIKFLEDKELDYTTTSFLLDNNNLVSIECYNLPEIMYYKFPRDVVRTRNRILFKSDFMKYNNINTYSDLYYKDKIVIDSYLTTYDVDDLIFFSKINKNINKVIIKGYCRQNLIAFLKIIKENVNKKINVILVQDDCNINELMNDVSLFEKFSKDYNVNIKIKYTKKYIRNNILKEINLKLVRFAIVFILIVNIFLFSGNKVYLKRSTDNIEIVNKQIKEIINRNNMNGPNVVESIQDNSKEEEQYISSYYQNYSNIYSELLNINSDTIGWLTVKGTKIDYPVVQYNDNDYYLNHAFDKSSNMIGWIFADYRNNFDSIDKNIIVYGHSMVDGGLMFTTLKKVLDSNWYLNPENLNIEFNIKGTNYVWKVFSIYVIDKSNDYLYTNFSTDSDFLEFVQKLKSRSIYDFNENIGADAHLLTLSTCYNDSNHRLVVHAFIDHL